MIRVFLPWPPSANAYWRVGNNRVYVSRKAKEYKAQVQGIFLAEKLRRRQGPVSLGLVITFPKDKRTATRDLDNCIKVLTDSVEGLAFENDNLIRIIMARKDGISGKGGVMAYIRGCSDSPTREEIHLAHTDLWISQ